MKAKFNLQFATDSRIAIYVPGTVNAVEAANNEAYVKETIKKLSLLFGGATATEARGGWYSQDHGVILEPVTIVYSFCKQTDLETHLTEVINICLNLKDELKQEAITLEINGEAAFI